MSWTRKQAGAAGNVSGRGGVAAAATRDCVAGGFRFTGEPECGRRDEGGGRRIFNARYRFLYDNLVMPRSGSPRREF